jgi:hypothetical protein
MTADIKQLADLARDENPSLTAYRVRASMGSALTQAPIENHSDLLAGAILCDTLGAIPGVDEDHYPGVIAHPQALATGPDAKAPSQFFGNLLANSTRRLLPAWLTPPGRNGRPATESKSGCSGATHCAASRLQRDDIFGDQGIPRPVARRKRVADPGRAADPDRRRNRRPRWPQNRHDPRPYHRYMAEGHLTLDYRFYAGGRHEIFNEPKKDRVHRHIGHWLSKVIDG